MAMKDDIKRLIAELLSSEDPDVRRRAAEDLSGQSGLAVIAALAAALKDENKGVRDAASHALLTMGGANVARAIVEYIADENIGTRNLAGELLHQLGGVSVPALLPYMQDGNHDVRKFAVDLVGLIGTESAVQHIIPLLQDPDVNVVTSAVEALGNLRNQEAVSHLVQTYRAEQLARAPVAEALGKLGGPEASEFLLLTFNKAMSDSLFDPVVLCTIIDSLGAVGDEHALIVLQNRIHEVQGKLRHALLHALIRTAERLRGKVNLSADLRNDLLDALNDDDAAIKASAAKALGCFTEIEVTKALMQCFAVSEELDQILYSLLEQRDDALQCAVEFLSDSQSGVKKQAIKLIGKLAMQLIRKVLHHETMRLDEGLLASAFEAVAAEWHSADEETRAAIVDTLFRLDGDRTVGFLDTLMEDPDPWLRMHVIEMLAAVEDRRIPTFVNRFLQDEDEMVREVAMSILQGKTSASGNEEVLA
jgi:HEAT repeat protein